MSIDLSLATEIRLAVRRLATRPVAILTLSLAIGAAVSMFGVIDRVLIRPLDVPEPSRLVAVRQMVEIRGVEERRTGMWWSVYEQMLGIPWSTLSVIGASSDRIIPDVEQQYVVFGDDTAGERVRGLFVTANYFRVLGLRPAFGRNFAPDEDTPAAAPTAMLSHRIWRGRFGSDDAVIGRTIRVNGVAVRVIGVAPPGFASTDLGAPSPEMYFPLHTAPRLLEMSAWGVPSDGGVYTKGVPNVVPSPISPIITLNIVGRIRDGAGLEQARAEFAARVDDGAGRSLIHLNDVALPFASQADVERLLTLLGAAVTLMLLIGCANLVGVLRAEAERRNGDQAVRAALGAGRIRLARAAVLEAMVLGLAGGAAGLVLSRWIDRAMVGLELPGGVPTVLLRDGADARLVLITLLTTVTAVTAISLGSASAWARVDIVRALQRRAVSPKLRGAQCLVAVQVVLSVLLVFGAFLFIRSVQEGLDANLGFEPEGLVSLTADCGPLLGCTDYSNVSSTSLMGSTRIPDKITVASVEALVERVRAIPGVDSATVAPTPLRHGSDWSTDRLRVNGETIDLGQPLDVIYADADYFKTLGQRVVRGRAFDGGDAGRSALVGIVNESMARRFWPDGDALGRQFVLGEDAPVTAVGVVENVRLTDLREEAPPIAYLAWAQQRISVSASVFVDAGAFLMVRSARETARLIPPIEAAAAGVGLAIAEVVPMDEQIATLLMPQRLGRGWLTLLAAAGLSLSVVGVYGLVSMAAARMEKEIGIRRALGASPGAVMRILARWVLWPVVVGMVGGSALALWWGGFADRFMYGISGSDPMTIVVTVVLLAMAVAGAALIPLRRALRMNVVDALRME